MNPFTTSLGCTILVRPAPENLGKGVILSLNMQPHDERYAEVFLTEDEKAALIETLKEES